MKININSRVQLTLTDSGREVYQEWLDQFPAQYQNDFSNTLEMPLWQVCQIFGNVMFMGQTKGPFFEENTLDFVEII